MTSSPSSDMADPVQALTGGAGTAEADGAASQLAGNPGSPHAAPPRRDRHGSDASPSPTGEQPKLPSGAVKPMESLRKYWRYGLLVAIVVLCAGGALAFKKRNLYVYSVMAKVYLAPRFATVLSEQKETDLDSYQKMRQFQEQQALMVKSYEVALDTLKILNEGRGPDSLIWLKPDESMAEPEKPYVDAVTNLTRQWRSQLLQQENQRLEALKQRIGKAGDADDSDYAVQDSQDEEELELAYREKKEPPELVEAKERLREVQKKNEERMRVAAEGLAAAVSSTVIKDSYLMNVGLEQTMDKRKVMPLDLIVNTLIKVYIGRSKSESFFTNKDVRIALLNTRREQLIKKINRRMMQRTAIAQELGVTTFSENMINPFDELLLDSKKAKDVAERNLIAAISAKMAFEDIQGKENREALDAASFEIVAQDPTLNTLKGNVNLRRTKLLEAVSGLEDSHPLKKNIDRELNEVDEELNRGTEEVTRRVAHILIMQRKTEVAKAQGIVDGINKQIAENQAKAKHFSERYNLALGYNNEIRRFQGQLEEIEIRKDKLMMEFHAPSMARLESQALEPAKGKGGWKKFAIISFAASLLLGLLVPIIIDFMKARGEIRTTNQLQNLIGYKPLAGLCEYGESLGRRLVLRDIMRKLAIALEREHQLQDAGLFLVTGVKPGAGVTGLAFDLALEFSELGIKALVVEVNPLNPDERYREYELQTGLIDLINGEGTLDEAISKASGSLPDRVSIGYPFHSHLYAYDKLRHVLAAFSKLYEVVMLDAAPVLSSADPEFLAAMADHTLFLVKARDVKPEEMRRAVSILEAAAPPAISFIVTNLEVYKWGGYFAMREKEYNAAHEKPTLPLTVPKTSKKQEPAPGMKPIFLYALHSGNLYGTERMALYALDGLREQLTPVVLAPPGPALAEAERLGIQAAPFRNTREFARKLRHQLADHKQIAFAATGVKHSLVFNFWNFFYRRQAVHLHLVHGGTDERESYGRKKQLNGKKVTFVAVSDYVRERLIANGVNPEQITVVGNFLPDERIRNAPRRPAFVEDGIRRVIVVSRIDPIKRVDLLLDAMDRHGGLQDLPVKVYGTGWDLDSQRARAEQTHPSVVFEGFSNAVAAELADSDLLLHLCPVEPFGLAILEAMAAGVPVLVPDMGGAAGLVKDRVSGYHFRADDPDDLAAVLTRLRHTPAEELNQIAAAATARLHSHYSGAACLDNYRKLFAEFLHA